MATKRTPLRRAALARVTPELLALWKQCREIIDDRGEKEFEPTGRRREYLDASNELRRGCGLKPWEVCPTDATSAEAPGYIRDNTLQNEGWRKAWKWRTALEAAAG